MDGLLLDTESLYSEGTQKVLAQYDKVGGYLRKILNLSELGTRSLFPGSLSAHFISIDRYRSSAHFANFQVPSSLNRSKKNQWFALGKER